MKKRTPEIKFPGKFDPQIRALIIYFVSTLVVLWVWQEVVRQVAVVTIPYSEFKAYVARHEVAEATIQQDEIIGRIVPRAAPDEKTPGAVEKPAGQAATVSPSPTQSPTPAKPFFFRTVRVEDPDLVNELQAAGVNYTGTLVASRPRARACLGLVRAGPSSSSTRIPGSPLPMWRDVTKPSRS
jgi:cell division protease FtsH